MGTAGFVLLDALAAFAVVGGTLVFAVGAATTLVACRLCLGHPRGPSMIATVGLVAAVAVALLWLDGRIGRYFAASFWLVVALGLPAGAIAATSRRNARRATIGWVGLFAVVFALRVPLAVPIGSAAVVGFVIEAVAVTFTGLPAVLVGAGGVSHARKHLSSNRD